MNYLEYFGLREPPFSLTPDPEFFFDHPVHRQALGVLLAALREGEGFLKVTGEVGTGKTLLCRKLLDSLAGAFTAVYLPNPLLGPIELHQAIAGEIGIPVETVWSLHRLQTEILDRVLALRRQGRPVVVCLDEAQAMSDVSLEALRLLSNLETEKRKLLQIVLFAQPELDLRLEESRLRQLRQRISFACRLTPFDREGVHGYVAHRLLVSGRQGDEVFCSRAIDALNKASQGVPRLINLLAHKALLSAFGRGDRVVDLVHVRAAVRDTAEAQRPLPQRLPASMVWGLVLVTLVEIFLILVFWQTG